ncbi:MAG: CHAT domain-containing protein [Anaerolineae bacterium]
MSQVQSPNAEIVKSLLALPALEQRAAFLSAADLLNITGLAQLLDLATHFIDSDPGQARRLAGVCAELADRAAAPAAIPRAAYIQAQTYAIDAEFETALALIESARQSYLSLGEELPALRTNIGLMTVLNQLGRYPEALAAGQMVVNTLSQAGQLKTPPTPEEAKLLVALTHQACGVTYEFMGRYDEALEVYATAEAYFLALKLTERLADIINNRGVILLNLGRGGEALAAFEAAAAIGAEAGLTLLHAQTLLNAGNAYLLLSNYMRSLDAFEQARRLLQSIDALADEAVLLLDTAETYLALNLYPEALTAYHEADRLLQSAGMAHDRARALRGIGSVLLAQLQFGQAEPVLAEAATLFAAADNIPHLSGVLLEQAALLAGQGDGEAALATARHALAITSGHDWPVQVIYAHLRLADLLLPDAAQAEIHLLQAQHLADTLALPHLRYRLNQRLGQVRRRQGRLHEAQTLLEAAVNDIEWLRGALAQEMLRTSFLHDKVTAYEELVQLYLGFNDQESAQRAFNIAERAKSRTLVDLLTGAIDSKLPQPAEIEAERRLRTLQADLNGIYNRWLGSRHDSQGDTPWPNLQARAVELEQEISRLRLQVAATAPATDPFAAALPFESVQAQLSPDLILLNYYICGDELMAFVNVQGQIRVVRHLSTLQTIQGLLYRLTTQWNRFRVGSAFVERHMSMLEQSAQRLLASLYTELMAPLEPLLTEAANTILSGQATPWPKLVIIPHGLLHQVPFQALFDGQQYLLERFEISYAPSATVLALCQGRTPPHPGKALVLGVPDPLIPAVASEVQAVVQQLDNPAVYVDAPATLAVLRAEAPGCDVLHLACHGLFRADNPMFSALKLSDDWLMAADVMQFDLTGALVTLSACESGRSQVIGGDELLGLARAFLGVGAATLVVSLWLVQDQSTASLMATWYEQLRCGLGRAAALRTAQLALKAQHPHPYYWAPFILLGQS